MINFEELYDYINTKRAWGYTHTCAAWASDLVFQVVGEDVDADDNFGFETPRELGQSIEELEEDNPTSELNPLPPDQDDDDTSS